MFLILFRGRFFQYQTAEFSNVAVNVPFIGLLLDSFFLCLVI